MNTKPNPKKTKADDGGTRLTGEALKKAQGQISDNWKIVEKKHLQRQFKFPDFRQALDFTNRVGEIAEKQGHHPDIFLTYGEVRLKIWTHKISGLTESDFHLAAKIDGLK
jgi:4a-hydroxytetrahydrobiopterin dehydratase